MFVFVVRGPPELFLLIRRRKVTLSLSISNVSHCRGRFLSPDIKDLRLGGEESEIELGEV